MNEFTVHRARLELRWVTISGWANHLGILPATQANLASCPQQNGKLSTSQSAVMLCGWEVKAGVAQSACECTHGWQVKLYNPSLIRAVPEHIRDIDIKRYVNALCTLLGHQVSIMPVKNRKEVRHFTYPSQSHF